MDIDTILAIGGAIGTFLGGIAGGLGLAKRRQGQRSSEDDSGTEYGGGMDSEWKGWRTTVDARLERLHDLPNEVRTLTLDVGNTKLAVAELRTSTLALTEQVTLLRIAIGELRVLLGAGRRDGD